ncbi:MAG: hypothetical protein R3325_16485 [Thermoanaerobaculia bacterium]|nr:hypothetical protein [Thermoanaerobaculia bacterium]
MTAHRPTAFAAAIALALAVAGCTTSPAIPTFEIDHFRFYEVEPQPAEAEVALKGQFDDDFVRARVERVTHFGNPSRKVHAAHETGVKRPDDHFTWYTIDQQREEPRRTIRFRNQFGQYSVDTRKARALLVPTQKTSHAGSAFPDRLDHYKCYQVIRLNTAPATPALLLGDQFGSQQGVAIIGPRFFCVPVVKRHPGHETRPLFDEETHYAVYLATQQPRPVEITTRDQFGERELSVLETAFFAVPTIKQVFVEHPD